MFISKLIILLFFIFFKKVIAISNFDLLLLIFVLPVLFIINLVNRIKTKKLFILNTELLLFLNGSAFILKPNLFTYFIPTLASVYIFLLGLISALVYIKYKQNKLINILFLLKAIILFTLSFALKFLTHNKIIFIKFTGIYLIICAVVSTFNLLFKNTFDVTFHLPIILTLFKAKNEFTKIKENYSVKKGPYNIQIFIHTTKKGISKYGHVDLYLDNKVFSFGSYDRSSEKLFGLLGDGMIYIVKDKEKYIKFLNSYSNKAVFAFGINLKKSQYENLKLKLKNILNNTTKWTPPAYYFNDFKTYKNDYSSNLYKNTNASFYKINSGSFKTYFTFYTNCVMFINHLIGKHKINPVNLTDLITPGVYFDYLNRLFKKKNSFVVSLDVYIPINNDNNFYLR